MKLPSLILLLIISFFFTRAGAQSDPDILNFNDIISGKNCDSSITSGWLNDKWEPVFFKSSVLDEYGYLSYWESSDALANMRMFINRDSMHLARSVNIYQSDLEEESFSTIYLFYNSANKVIRYISILSKPGGIKDSSYQGFYTYDSSNNLLNSLFQEIQNGKWLNTTRMTYTNNSKGLPVFILHEDWDFQNGTWRKGSEKTLTYDSNARIINEFNKVYLTAGIVYSRTSYTYYNTGELFTTFSENKVSDSTWQNIQTDSFTANKDISYQWSGDHWEPIMKQECIQLNNAVNMDAKPGKLLIYPNPGSYNVTICTEALTGNYFLYITDILGKSMLKKEESIQNDRLKVDVSFLRPGIYNVELSNQKGRFTSKLIILK
jgi:hypothetical protein